MKTMNDLISRQEAIDAIEKIYLPQTKGETAAEEINRVAWRCALNCAKEMVGHLPPAQQWIPVSERLPEPGQWVIATYERTYSDTGRTRRLVVDTIYSARKGWDDTPGIRRTVAWMPLPEPFKEVE